MEIDYLIHCPFTSNLKVDGNAIPRLHIICSAAVCFVVRLVFGTSVSEWMVVGCRRRSVSLILYAFSIVLRATHRQEDKHTKAHRDWETTAQHNVVSYVCSARVCVCVSTSAPQQRHADEQVVAHII